MRPRDRALKALNHEEIYPVPVDLFENGIYPALQADLCRHYELAPNNLEGLLRRLGAAFRWANPVYIGPPLKEDPTQKPGYPHRVVHSNIWGTLSGPNSYSDELINPLANAETVEEVQVHNWPDPDWFDYHRVGVPYQQPERSQSLAAWAESKQDYIRVVGGWNPIASRVMDMFGMQKGLMNLALRPDLIEAALDHIGEFLEEYYQRLARSARGHVEVLAFGDDFASQRAMLFSPASYRKYFLPLTRRLFEIAHKHDMKAMFHSCGAIGPILGDLVDAGLDILDVVQVTAHGMDARGLKRQFGQHLVFYGGVDVQQLMPYGKPNRIRDEVQGLVETLGKNGGYVCTTCHFLMDDVPVSNVLVMYEEATNYHPLRD
jgi:uroporphyrinogen decarboxylase